MSDPTTELCELLERCITIIRYECSMCNGQKILCTGTAVAPCVSRRIEDIVARLRSNGPDGIRCVPVEPTPAILQAGYDAICKDKGWFQLVSDSYKAMLSAGGERD